MRRVSRCSISAGTRSSAGCSPDGSSVRRDRQRPVASPWSAGSWPPGRQAPDSEPVGGAPLSGALWECLGHCNKGPRATGPKTDLVACGSLTRVSAEPHAVSQILGPPAPLGVLGLQSYQSHRHHLHHHLAFSLLCLSRVLMWCPPLCGSGSVSRSPSRPKDTSHGTRVHCCSRTSS